MEHKRPPPVRKGCNGVQYDNDVLSNMSYMAPSGYVMQRQAQREPNCPKRDACERHHWGLLAMASGDVRLVDIAWQSMRIQAENPHPHCFWPHPEMSGAEVHLIIKDKQLPPRAARALIAQQMGDKKRSKS